jgi:two-component system, NarL family, response regulator NreC
LPKIQLLLVDDHEIFRRGLRSLLANFPQFEVCGEAADGDQAIAEAARLRPDIIVMDISMPNTNGLEATKIIRKMVPSVRIVIMSQHDSAHMMKVSMIAGASAYVTKSQVARDLILALQYVAKEVLATRHDVRQPGVLAD